MCIHVCYIYTVFQKCHYLSICLDVHELILIILFAEMLLRNQAMKRCFIFPPHLTNASALPGKTGNPENVSVVVASALPHANNLHLASDR